MFDKKPCPGCKTPYPWLVRVHPVRLLFTRYYVECWKCHWCGKTKIGKRRAVKAWNKIPRKSGEQLKHQWFVGLD